MQKIYLAEDFKKWYLEEFKKFLTRITDYTYDEINIKLQSTLYKSLDEILLLSPSGLQSCAQQIKNYHIMISNEDRDYFENLYVKFRRSITGEKFIEKVALNVCPYCNRNYIYNFNDASSTKTTAQLDHFYDKSSYPYLAVSLYNLIPSCGTCNLRKSKKHTPDKPILNPYLDSFDDFAKFRLNGIKSLRKSQKYKKEYFAAERIKFSIEPIKSSTQVATHISMFNLKELYQNHKDIMSDLLNLRILYSEEHIKSLIRQHPSLFKSREDVLSLILCRYEVKKNINKSPLSKLTRDLAKQLGF